MSIKRIGISKLRLGMYVHKLESGWFDHPFWRGSFLLERHQDLEAIRKAGIRLVWIDTAKGLAPGLAARDMGLATQAAAAVQADAVGSDRQAGSDDRPGTVLPGTVETLQPAHRLPADVKPEEVVGVTLEEEIRQARRLCMSASDEVMGLFEEARMGRAIHPEAALPLVQEISDSIRRHPHALISAARLKTRDNYTYLHSVAVCALMTSLSSQLGLDPVRTRQAGVGGLMHDLGKAAIPLDILNKPGRLTEAEFDLVKRHPSAGAEMLRLGGADEMIQSIALHHHEKYDGSGYPCRLSGQAIPLLARMGAVCDVYDAVTSLRAYKPAWEPAETMRRMASWEGHFDRQVFEAFVKTVGIYPLGSLVRLQSRRLGVVVAPGDHSLLAPHVEVVRSVDAGSACPNERLNLGDPDCDDRIVGPEDPSDWNLGGLEAYWLGGTAMS
ncbi:HD-GYP domain-containing protein [Castellaniella hirudinis]|uniref:HD-GYP domain-containing protein n=1 Tax=Castellaniella hirudinis TaxID=1144617 RepID=A0ABV8RX93_9BURK